MLDQLIALTSKDDFWDNCNLKIKQVLFQPATLKFTMPIEIDDSPSIDQAADWWTVECRGMVTESGICQLDEPNFKINIFKEHPLFWQYETSVNLIVIGKVK